jgi:ankyrin repeat protein
LSSIVSGCVLVGFVCAAVAVLRMPPPAELVFQEVRELNHPGLAASVRAEPAVVGWRDSIGYTLLHWAAAMNDGDAVEMLLDAGADPNARDIRGRTPLHVAAMSQFRAGGDALLKALVARGADVNAADAQGATPLQFAQRMDRQDLSKSLLAAGAKPDQASDTRLAATPPERARLARPPFPPGRRPAWRAMGARRAWVRLNGPRPHPIEMRGEG